MITRENIKPVLLSLEPEDITNALNGPTDYIGVWLSSYGQPNVSNVDYPLDEDILASGGFICDKDDFLRLFDEQHIDIESILNQESFDLISDSNRGIYGPQHFCEIIFRHAVNQVKKETIQDNFRLCF